MAYPIGAKTALSLTTVTTSSDQITPTYQFISKGKLILIAKASATELTCRLSINGQLVVPDTPVMYFGTSGTMSARDNIILEQNVNPGRVELYFTNPTGGTVTVDFILLFEPAGGR